MKYPRTFHLPWSPGGTNDDKIISSVEQFLNKSVVVTEKIDGSNLCLTKTNIFARSHAGPPKHESFNLAKSLHAQIKDKIPKTHLVFGEWCFAVHDIYYDCLPNYFISFAVLIENQWQSWNYVKDFSKYLNLSTAPELFIGKVSSRGQLQKTIDKLSTGVSSFGTDTKEGTVIRLASNFKDFSNSVAKWVREDHPRNGNEHWMYKQMVKQKLK